MKAPIAAAILLSGSLLWAQQQEKPLTTNAGAPVGDNQDSVTAGENGPVLLQDLNLIDKLQSFDRERIPERVVHARGVGAHGFFESYADESQYTKAAFLNKKGKVTPLFVRFSTVMNPSGSPETIRDPRGFAVKLYTEQGNYDIVGNDLPVFFIRDAIKFPDFVHALKPSPVTNRQDANRVFDFLSHVPESTNMLTYVYSNMGTPATYRQMDGYGVHAFKWVNAKGEVVYVKYKWTSLQGHENLNPRTIPEVIAQNYQAATEDLYDKVGKGDFPSWELSVQIVKPEDLSKFDFNPFDDTKIWPEEIAPSIKIGKMTLNRMPSNYFAETEQSTFAPGNMVPGIEPSPDRMLQGRLFAYLDTQRYRVGPNFQQLPVNRPISEVNSYNQNGPMDYKVNQSEVNYQPNGAPVTYKDNTKYNQVQTQLEGVSQQKKISSPDDYRQAGALYLCYSEADRADLITNLVGDLSGVKDRNIQIEMVSHFYKANTEYGTRLANALHLDVQEVSQRAAKL
jgi:catalase